MKKLIIGGVINAVITLTISASAAWGVIHYMYPGNGNNKQSPSSQVEKKKIDAKDITFFSMPETIITLHDKDDRDRYMLVELVFIVNGKDKEQTDQLTADQPFYQSVVVDTLSNISYEDVRRLHVSEIKDLLLKSINKGVLSHNMETPYEDLLIKKVVYQ